MKAFTLYLVFFCVLISGNVSAFDFNIPIKKPTELVVYPPPVFFYKPDLVVTEFNTTGITTVTPNGSRKVPVRAVIKNQGEGVSSIFMVSAESITPKGDFMIAFTVSGQGSSWKPTTMASLYPGETVAIEGVLSIHPYLSGETVDFYIIADSCAADEFMPSHCRVLESDETNNESNRITVNLP